MAKQTKGKDANGVFHPGKGKPSGINKEEGLGIQATPPEKMDQYLEVTEKYTLGEDQLDPSIRLLHPNRNTSKGEDQFKGKENKKQSDKTVKDSFTEERSLVIAEEIPAPLTRESFLELANFQADGCISIFLGAHVSGVEVNEGYDAIHFKNQLQEVNKRLIEKGYQEDQAKRLLQPGFEFVKNDDFWKQLSPGLAVFISEGSMKYIKMPIAPQEELIVIEPTYYV